jgi:hypothetical protein
MVFISSAPRFENHLRSVSVPANEKPTSMIPDEQKECDHEGHVIYRELEKQSKKVRAQADTSAYWQRYYCYLEGVCRTATGFALLTQSEEAL